MKIRIKIRMKLQVKRAFKSYSFCVTKKAIKKQAGPAENCYHPLMKLCRGVSIGDCFKTNASFFCCPHFFEEYLNPHPGQDQEKGKQI